MASCLDEPAFLASADDDTRMLHKRRVLDETRKVFETERKEYSKRIQELAAREREVAAMELAFKAKMERFAIYCDDEHQKRGALTRLVKEEEKCQELGQKLAA